MLIGESMAYKYNYEMAKRIVEEKGFKLLSETFESINQSLIIESEEGYLFKTHLNGIIRGNNFNYFDSRNPYTIKNINLWILLNNRKLMLIDNKFISAKYKMRFKCLICNDIFESNWNNIKSGKGCRKCSYVRRGNNRKKYDTLSIKTQLKTITPFIEILGEYVSYHTPISCKCLKHDVEWEASWANLKKGKGCVKCGLEKNIKENHFNWKGGITPLHNHLRWTIKDWKVASFKKYNSTCDITGLKSDSNIIHHLYGFEYIIKETLNMLNLPLHNDINGYTTDELNSIESLCLKLHFKYGLGVCLTNDIHKEFHHLYGYGQNTPTQYCEFKNKKLII